MFIALFSTVFGLWLVGCIIAFFFKFVWWTFAFAVKALGWLILACIVLALLSVPFIAAVIACAALLAGLAHAGAH